MSTVTPLAAGRRPVWPSPRSPSVGTQSQISRTSGSGCSKTCSRSTRRKSAGWASPSCSRDAASKPASNTGVRLHLQHHGLRRIHTKQKKHLKTSSVFRNLRAKQPERELKETRLARLCCHSTCLDTSHVLRCSESRR